MKPANQKKLYVIVCGMREKELFDMCCGVF